MMNCGKIFLQLQQMALVIECTLCENKETFQELEAFSDHINEQHVNKEQIEEIEIEILDTVEEIDDTSQSNDETNNVISHQTTENTVQETYEYKTLNAVEDSIHELKQEKSEMNCQYCFETFDSSEEFMEHNCNNFPENVNETTKPFQCDICTKRFTKKSNLRTHEFSHIKNKPFHCGYCPATYANKQNLIIHERRHKGEKPFECDYCGQRFVSSTERNSHRRSHTGERPFICPDCGHGYTTSSHLLDHRRRKHLDIRNYICDNCGKAFRNSSQLRSHKDAVHAGLPRNITCNDCNATFKTPAGLYAHSKIHYKKRYKCKICGKEFAQHPGLYTHMKIHNKKQTTAEKSSSEMVIEFLDDVIE